jgi:hypothetical protein
MIGTFALALLLTAAPGQSVAPRPQLAEETMEAIRLRARLGTHELTSSQTIYVHSQSAHHVTEDFTRIATRGADGRWTVISIGEERAGPVGPPGPPQPIPEERRVLTASESEHLDRLLHWPPLYHQSSPGERNLGVGAYFHVMEIVTPQGHAVLRWNGRLRGWAARWPI